MGCRRISESRAAAANAGAVHDTSPCGCVQQSWKLSRGGKHVQHESISMNERIAYFLGFMALSVSLALGQTSPLRFPEKVEAGTACSLSATCSATADAFVDGSRDVGLRQA